MSTAKKPKPLPKPRPFNQALKDSILALIAEGKSNKEVAKILGINARSLAYWIMADKTLRESVEAAQDIANDIVESSLFQKATGYTHAAEKIFVHKGDITRVRTIQHYPPDTEAIKYWLNNRRPESWNSAGAQSQSVQNPFLKQKTFTQFCADAGYPEPFEKQIEMFKFAHEETEARLLLGARGYGKTDYAVALGMAYRLYLEPLKWRFLLVTKSEERNAAILGEIAKACELNGVIFEKKNSTSIRTAGLLGKDHSVSSVTIGASSIRGRHPDMIIMDDPVTEEDVSEATRKRVQRVYNELNKLCPNILVIGQPVHKADLYEKLRPLLLKLEVPHGSIPELDHDLEAQRLAGVSEESIQASYFLKVISENPTPFEKIRFIDRLPQDGSAVAFIDPSFEGGDYTALTIAKAHFDNIAILGRVYKKAWNHCIDDMVKEIVTNNVGRLCFETNSLGDMPIELLRSAVPEGVGVVGKKSTNNKHSRIMNAGAFAHQLELAKTSDAEYIKQVTEYEYNSEHDDAPDSLASLLEWLGLIRGKKV